MQLSLILTPYAPVLCLAKITATPFNASFDDLAADSVIPATNPIQAPYDGLAYPGFNARANGESIIKAHSPNNSASSNQLNQQLEGSVAMITATYSGSKVSNFDMDSRSHHQIGGRAPTNLYSAINGTTSSGKTVVEICSYQGTVSNPALVLCEFSTLKSVKAVSIFPAESETLPTTTVTDIDNFVGKYYSSS